MIEYAKIIWKNTLIDKGISDETLLTLGYEDGAANTILQFAPVFLAIEELRDELIYMYDSLDKAYAVHLLGDHYKKLIEILEKYEATTNK